MGFRYVVLGAGRQGVVSGYDLARRGDADEVLFVDEDISSARSAARLVNEQLQCTICSAAKAHAGSGEGLTAFLKGRDGAVSSVPFRYNLDITRAAVRSGCNMVDLGGHTGVVRKQHGHDAQARERNISVVPDCGMGPGMNISLAVHAMSLLDAPKEVYIWDGGLPQQPKPPWNYELTFNIGGLLNEYSGSAYFLRNGRIVEVPCFEGYEEVVFPPPMGKLEAFVTSGGLSTMPWTCEGVLETLENRTLRYPGHHAQFSALAGLGLLESEPVLVSGAEVVPRDLLATLLEPHITNPHARDVCIIRVRCTGEKDGRPADVVIDLTDYHDEKTGFTAMQRLTGWHAAIMLQQAVRGKIPRGVVPVESIPGEIIVQEAKTRGFSIDIRVNEPD